MARVWPRARKMKSGKVAISMVNDMIHRAMLFMVTWAAGSQAQHEASKTHLWLALECLNPTMFNWVDTVTANMKRQLTRCRRGETKLFGYRSILVLLMLDRVPASQLQDMDLDFLDHVRPRLHGGHMSCHEEVADD